MCYEYYPIKQNKYKINFLQLSDTAIYGNFWAVMHDKNYWKDPETFRPERFIDSDGQFIRDDRCVPFSLGKRYCIGQVDLKIIKQSIFQI